MIYCPEISILVSQGEVEHAQHLAGSHLKDGQLSPAKVDHLPPGI